MASASDPLIGNAPALATKVLARLCSNGLLSLLRCLLTCCSRVCLFDTQLLCCFRTPPSFY